MKTTILMLEVLKECNLDLRASPGYVKEAEKLEMNYTKINLHITLKEAATKKLKLCVKAYSLEE